ncbi:hypothetical protein EON79_05360 [bacterium]|nr:MAG: hypothetical protein EON79_05360 [bacterium]
MVVLPLLALLGQSGIAEEAAVTWRKCAEAHRALRRYSDHSDVFNLVKGKRKRSGSGQIAYAAPREYDFTYRDDLLGVTCNLSQTASGKWSGGTSEDTFSANPGGSNAQGYADTVVDRWSYAPLALALNENTSFFDGFSPVGATAEEKMDGVLCLRMTDGPSGQPRTILWIQKSSRLLVRVRRESKEDAPELTLFHRK